jgi:hypothetical protein
MLIAGAFIAAASALSSQAADQSAYFAQQRQITDGYYPQYSVDPTPARAKPATSHQVAENEWLTRERARGSGPGVAPVPFPPPSRATMVAQPKSEGSPYTAAENAWLTQERNETDGNVAPVPFTPPSHPEATTGMTAADGR